MAFDAFDKEKKGCISTNMVGTILGMLGHEVSSEELAEIISEIDTWGKYIIANNAIYKIEKKSIEKEITFFTNIRLHLQAIFRNIFNSNKFHKVFVQIKNYLVFFLLHLETEMRNCHLSSKTFRGNYFLSI